MVRIAFALPCIALSACAGPLTPAGNATVDSSFHLGGTRWDTGGEVYVLYRIENSSGVAAVCGVWSDTGGENAHLNQEVMASYAVDVGGTRILQNLDYFPKVANIRTARGQNAVCRKGTVAWSPAFAEARPRLVLTQRRFQAD